MHASSTRFATPTEARAPSEGRHSPRIRFGDRCDIVSHCWEQPVPHHAADLSAGGIWVDTFLPLHAGAEVVVSFVPPGWRRELIAFAHVRRVVTGRRRRDRGPLGMALELSGLTGEERRRLGASVHGGRS